MVDIILKYDYYYVVELVVIALASCLWYTLFVLNFPCLFLNVV